jgi:hypothetical protein
MQKDVLEQMEFPQVISSDLTIMDPRIFKPEKMKGAGDFSGSLEERCIYHAEDHTMYCDLFGITLNNEDDVEWCLGCLRVILTPYVDVQGPIDMVVNYDGFDIGKGLEDTYSEQVSVLQEEMNKSIRQYTGQAFQRVKLKTQLRMSECAKFVPLFTRALLLRELDPCPV